MKLALVIGSLGGGGAERVMTTLANAWVQRGVGVALITIADADHDAYPLAPEVVRIGLGLACRSRTVLGAWRHNRSRILALRAALRVQNPDVILSFTTAANVVTLLAARPLGIPVVISERSVWGEHKEALPWRVLRRHYYRRAAVAVSQTSAAAKDFQKGVPGVPVEVIPNPVERVTDTALDVPAKAALAFCRGGDILLAVGRLSAEKGYDLLLPAFAMVLSGHPSWRLVIAGEGPERSRIEAQIAALRLSGRVILAGFTGTPQALMHHAQVYVLSSRHEGFPNALLEAMSCGLACVSFNCPTGPAEIIENDVNGLLVPRLDARGLAAALERLMSSAMLRERLGQAAQLSVKRFALESVLAHWTETLEVAMTLRDAKRAR